MFFFKNRYQWLICEAIVMQEKTKKQFRDFVFWYYLNRFFEAIISLFFCFITFYDTVKA